MNADAKHYNAALSIAAKAVRRLSEDEGNMSQRMMEFHIHALHTATLAIAKRNGYDLTPKPEHALPERNTGRGE